MNKKYKLDIIFTGIYFFEQILLILLYITFPKSINILIGIFPVIFLTTIAFEKILIKLVHKEELDLASEPIDNKTRVLEDNLNSLEWNNLRRKIINTPLSEKNIISNNVKKIRGNYGK